MDLLLWGDLKTIFEPHVEDEIWKLQQRNVTSSKPIKIQEAIRMAHDLIDQVVRFMVAKGVDNKRKWDANQRNNFRKQNKRQEVVRDFTARMGERRRGNQNDSERGRGRVFVIGGGEARQDPNIVLCDEKKPGMKFSRKFLEAEF
ncbi:hypothetical protein Tco_0540842 [Tanacetum coccineum]